MVKRLNYNIALTYCLQGLTLDVLRHYSRALFRTQEKFSEFSEDLKQVSLVKMLILLNQVVTKVSNEI